MATTSMVGDDKFVLLTMLPPDVWDQIQKERFTVQRNPLKPSDPKPGEPGAREETGWRIQEDRHSYNCGYNNTFITATNVTGIGDAVATRLVAGSDGQYIWRIYMNNGLDGDELREPDSVHACGWRVCDPARRTFWPTRLTTPMEREAWWTWFDAQLNSLPLWIQAHHGNV
jgi:hypothetical protein